MSHINALELSRASDETESANNNTRLGAGDGAGEDIVANNSDKPQEDDDGWTTVTKGGRKKRGG